MAAVALDPTAITGIGAVALAIAFLLAAKLSRLEDSGRGGRQFASFASGISAAYVFMHMLPELAGARSEFAEAAGERAPFEGQLVYFTALAGFLVAFGMERFRKAMVVGHDGGDAASARIEAVGSRIHVGGFCAYAALVTFVLVGTVWDPVWRMALYVGAVAAHFLTVGHALHEEHGAAYQRVGRWLLGAACVAGWAAGATWQVSPLALSLVVAWLSGAVIMNSTILELAPDRPGRLLPFMAGGLAYGSMLVPLG